MRRSPGLPLKDPPTSPPHLRMGARGGSAVGRAAHRLPCSSARESAGAVPARLARHLQRRAPQIHEQRRLCGRRDGQAQRLARRASRCEHFKRAFEFKRPQRSPRRRLCRSALDQSRQSPTSWLRASRISQSSNAHRPSAACKLRELTSRKRAAVAEYREPPLMPAASQLALFESSSTGKSRPGAVGREGRLPGKLAAQCLPEQLAC